MGTTYKDAGVDIDKGDAFVERIKAKVKSTYGERVRSGVGGFAALYEVGDRFLAVGADGVGTKLKISQTLDIHHTIGIDLVAMCVNDIICTGATPLFFMDYLAVDSLDLRVAEQIIDGIVEGCRQSKMALIGGETAEMPGLYAPGDYDLAGFAVGEVFPQNIIDGQTIAAGHALIGLRSSGLHSNGFSLFRKLCQEQEVELMKEALTPTQIYTRPVAHLLKAQKKSGELVAGLAHITGGGLNNIPRMNNQFDYKINRSFTLGRPKIFDVIQERSQLSDFELYRTFNMGLGLCIATPAPERVMKLLAQAGAEGLVIGEVVEGNGCVHLSEN